jgi:hypothetical protein
MFSSGSHINNFTWIDIIYSRMLYKSSQMNFAKLYLITYNELPPPGTSLKILTPDHGSCHFHGLGAKKIYFMLWNKIIVESNQHVCTEPAFFSDC